MGVRVGVVVVSGSYEHACINKTCSVHPPSWVSCSLHFVHFMVSEAGWST